MNADQNCMASCFCGGVEIRLTGAPVVMGYCHCESCRRWSGSPVSAFTMWAPGSVAVAKGGDAVGTFSKTPHALRKWCRECGGHLFTEHPGLNLTDVPAAVITGLAFQPTVHVNYSEATLPVKDGLPKFSDIPAPLGGTGALLPE